MATAVNKLIIHRASQLMASGSIGETVNRLKNITDYTKKAKMWVDDAIAAVRSSRDADPKWTDEDIAQQIVDALIENTCTCMTGRLPGTLGHLPTCPAKTLANGHAR